MLANNISKYLANAFIDDEIVPKIQCGIDEEGIILPVRKSSER